MIRMEKGSWGGPLICSSFSALWRLFLAHFLLRNLLSLARRAPSAAGWPRVTKALTADPRKQSIMSLFLWSFSLESRSALLFNTEKKKKRRKREGTIREIKLYFQISHSFWKEVGDISICRAWKKLRVGGGRTTWLPFPRGFKIIIASVLTSSDLLVYMYAVTRSQC